MFRQRKHKIQKIMKKSNLFRGMFPILAVGVMALAETSLTSCSRSNDDEQVEAVNPLYGTIVGTWKLTKYEQKDTDGVYQTAPLYVLYHVYGSDKKYKHYSNAAPSDPSAFVLEVTIEIKNKDIFFFNSLLPPGAPGSRYKIEINGNTMVQIKDGDGDRYTYTKQ